MKVYELADELNTTSEFVLQTLKSLMLKAKDREQDLSAAVVSVLKSEIAKTKKIPPKKEEPKKEQKPISLKTKKSKEIAESPLVKEKPKSKVVQKTEKKEKEERISEEESLSKAASRAKMMKKGKEKQEGEESPVKEKITVKKTTAPKETVRTKINKEPLITLKPLARKKRKSTAFSKEELTVSPSVGKEKPGGLTPTSPFSGVAQEISSSSPAVETSRPQVVSASSVSVMEEMQAPEEVLPEIEIRVPTTVKDFSVKIQQKSSVVLKELMKFGIFAHINQNLDIDTVKKLTRQFGFSLAKVRTQEEQLIEDHKKEDENPALLKQRSPVVTFMGHVDHGKTTLLDRIRKSRVADSEHGGITQHMGAYSVTLPKGRITFLDTPGHEAFTSMRARGAHITDLVVLVVAADEGVMQQTEEAIDHARAAGVPILVALNKIDRRNADIDRVKKELSERDLMPEDWGGKTVVAPVSAVTGEGVDSLLEMILLEAELLELKTNYEKSASGIVVEAHLSGGKGAVTTLIVQSGTLREGDILVVGPHLGKVKAMFDDHKRAVKEAGPSMPVEILGLSHVPEAGEAFYVVADEKQAKEITSKREEDLKNKKLHSYQKISLEDLYSQIQQGVVKELSVIIKADVQGSLEALKDSLEKIPSDKVKLKFIHLGVGDINASDVVLAVASKAIIIGFHVGVDPRAKQELEKKPVDVRHYRIIYDAVNDIKNALEGMLEAKTRKKFLSRIEIREVFKLSKHGIVAGCFVVKGKVNRKVHVDVLRNDAVVYSGVISSLKRFKDDVRDVAEGMECGISVEGFDKYQVGDIIEAYEIESIAQKL